MNSLLKFIDSAYSWFLRVANLCQSPFLLAVRLYFGWYFFDTGRGKLADIQTVVNNFIGWNVPAPVFNAHFIAWLETVGGIMLMLGLASRLMAVPMAIDMIVAYIVADRDKLYAIFSDQEKFTSAAPFNFLFVFLLILFFGPGFFSLDTLIRWLRKKFLPEAAAAPASAAG